VARSGSKTWHKDHRWQGVRQTFTIGTYPKVQLADARNMAMQLNDWLREGLDRRRQTSRQGRKREQPEAKPFREVVDAWFGGSRVLACWFPYRTRVVQHL